MTPEVPNEPKANDENQVIRVFNSFEEANEYKDEQVRNQPPLLRIQETVELIKRIYPNWDDKSVGDQLVIKYQQ
jgi:hypothetical protein